MYDNIPGIPTYFVSKEGEIWKRDAYTDSRSGRVYQKREGKWKKVKTQISICREGKTPYERVRLCTNFGGKLINGCYRVHRLVAMAWVPNPDPEHYTVVCHKNNDSLNNNWDNLYWGTQAMNMKQAAREGRTAHNSNPGKIGETSPVSKYSNRKKWRVYRYKQRHPAATFKEMKRVFDMPFSVISKIIKAKDPVIWKHLK